MISDYYSGKSILLTGSTGFLGKVLLEKLLWSLPSIKTIYVSIKPKRAGVVDEYTRFKQEILDSKIFDRHRIAMGVDTFRKEFIKKVLPFPMDPTKENLGMDPKNRQTIKDNVNIIINCDSINEFDTEIGLAVKANVQGPLQLLLLAQECKKIESFCQISSSFSLADRTGFLEERVYESQVNWLQLYNRIQNMSEMDKKAQTNVLLSGFPNTYSLSMRMSEEVLLANNKTGIPLVIVRPSIIGTSAQEPIPGWTENLNSMQEAILMTGLGMMRDIIGNGDNLIDVIPVDYIARQIIVSIPTLVKKNRETQGKAQLFITHCTSSSLNPIATRDLFNHITYQQNKSPYEKRVNTAQVTFHSNSISYKAIRAAKQTGPLAAKIYATKFLPMSGTRNQLREQAEKLMAIEERVNQMEFFLQNEWVFDSASVKKMLLTMSSDEKLVFNIDISRLQWKYYAWDMAYGIKKNILKEEAALPSLGYADAVQHMIDRPEDGKPIKVRQPEEMVQLILSSEPVKKEIAKLVKKRLDYYTQTLHHNIDEGKVYKEVYAQAKANIERIASKYQHKAVAGFSAVCRKVFTRIYDKIIINENAMDRVRSICANRKGPVIFCPTHRSYVDFILVSCLNYFYSIEVPHICAGEDLMMIKGVSHLLRASGAFFMRRTFRGDDLYKAIFTEYVTQLLRDSINIEFFIEGTRSRTNKMLAAKFGIMSILSNAFFTKQVEEITIIPVTLNYTRTLEDASFPKELTGSAKVKESLGRILGAFEVLKMNFGTINVDFYDPIRMTELQAQMSQEIKGFDPVNKKSDRLRFNNKLGNDLVLILQQNIRIMPTTICASILLLHRKGISQAELQNKMTWLGIALKERGAVTKQTDGGLPAENSLAIGLKQLKDFISLERNVWVPKVTSGDYTNFTMLNYYRNPLNFIFFNEGVICVSIFSFGNDEAWNKGVSIDGVFDRACFLAQTLKREEQLRERITPDNRAYFDSLLNMMQTLHMVEMNDGQIKFQQSAEINILFSSSIIWPLVDNYYITLIFALSLQKSSCLEATYLKDVQWLGESLFFEGKLKFFESLNQEVFKTSKAHYTAIGVFQKKEVYIRMGQLLKKQRESPGAILGKMLEELGQFRCRSVTTQEFENPTENLRQQMMTSYPFMAKL